MCEVPGLLSAEWMEVHLHLFPTAEHPDGGVEPSDRDHHLPPADYLTVPGEEHLDEHRGATVSQHFHSWRGKRVSQHFHRYRAEAGYQTVLVHTSAKTLATSGHDMSTRKHLANICFLRVSCVLLFPISLSRRVTEISTS